MRTGRASGRPWRRRQLRLGTRRAEWSPRSQTDHDYYCKNCGHKFDDLHVRGPKGTNRGPKPETMLKRYAKTEVSD